MPAFSAKSFDDPDDVIHMPGVDVTLIDLGDLTVGRAVHQPGWRWSTHVKPVVGGEWCQVRHVGVVLSGRFGTLLSDGTSFEVEEDGVYDIPAGHDGYTIGHEPLVVLEWTGVRAFAGFLGGLHNRVLASLLVTEVVNSAARARELGTAAWRELSSEFFEAVRARFEMFGGREVSTSGDHTLASFNSPVQAVECAAQLRSAARAKGLKLRAGVHVGEVEVVGNDLRGAVVHETERIMQSAPDDEILVSETARILSATSGLTFNDAGSHPLGDNSSNWRLFAYVSDNNLTH